MERCVRLSGFAAIACLAIVASGATMGALGQSTVESSERLPGNRPESPANDQSAASERKPLLKGGAVDETSPMWIIQRRGPSAIIDMELSRRAPMLAPSLPGALQGRVDQSAPLQGQLNARDFILPTSVDQPKFRLRGAVDRGDLLRLPAMNFIPPMTAPDAPTQPVLGARTPSLSPTDSDRVSREINLELSRAPGWGAAGLAHGRGPLENPVGEREFNMPSDAGGQSAASAEIRGKLLKPALNSTADIDGQLRRANSLPTVPDVEGVLRAQQAIAKPALDKQAVAAATEIRAVFRRAPQTPADLEVSARLMKPDVDNAISWDAWYARVAKLAEPLLAGAVEGRGGPSGTNTVSITVQANHRVSVDLVNGDNAAFDAAIMHAYRGLDKNLALAFPAGSHRTEVIFLADNNHLAPGDVSGVTTQTCVGDSEILRKRF